MPEETALSSASGHEGSLSLMPLFVLFQSAASSDGGEYIFFNYALKRFILTNKWKTLLYIYKTIKTFNSFRLTN